MSTLPVAGLWSRQWEEDPLGDADGADRTTLVWWVQSRDSGIYVDLRLPLDSPGRSLEAAQKAGITRRPGALAARGVSDTNKAALEAYRDVLLRQKSFAGILTYTAGDTTSGEALQKDSVLADLARANAGLSLCTCFWRRDLDYQPPTGGLDVGVCASEAPKPDGSVLLRETGDDASYAEGWLRQSEKGPFMALELVSEDGRPRSGYWVRAGNIFAYAVGRPATGDVSQSLGFPSGSDAVKEAVGKTLTEALVSSTHALDVVASYVAVAGEVDGDQWSIRHATNPELVGCSLIGGDVSSCCSQVTQSGNYVEQTIGDGDSAIARVWRVKEQTDCSLPQSP